jgi:hypothetical protein
LKWMTLWSIGEDFNLIADSNNQICKRKSALRDAVLLPFQNSTLRCGQLTRNSICFISLYISLRGLTSVRERYSPSCRLARVYVIESIKW